MNVFGFPAVSDNNKSFFFESKRYLFLLTDWGVELQSLGGNGSNHCVYPTHNPSIYCSLSCSGICLLDFLKGFDRLMFEQ